jgi:bacterioferritin-associated ferredoxin
MEMDRRLENLLERGVDALEKLAQDEFEFQVETKPPVCPHCDTINPTVRVSESTTQGRLAEFVIQAFCTNCNNIFYVIPLQSDCVKTQEDARNVISDKLRIGGYEHERENPGAPVGSDASRTNGM